MKNPFQGVLFKSALPVILTVAWFFALPASALAHARLVRSSPEVSGELAKPPAKIDLWYSELLDKEFNSISIYAAADTDAKTRTNLASGDPQLDAKDLTHLSIAVKPLPPGEYFVEWRVLSKDGHTAPGRFKFRVRAGS